MKVEKLTVSGRIRMDILRAGLSAGKTGAHLAPSMSLVELTYAILKNYKKEKDVFILGKGHGALGYYATMHQLGMITDTQFDSFEENGGEFPGQPSRTPNNNVDCSSGSLGMGLPYGVGMARGKNKEDGRVYVVLGDGEVNEGSVWEAAALAAHLKLSNLIAVIDNNGLQSDGECDQIMRMDLEKIWNAFGWHTVVCDGHDIAALEACLNHSDANRPTVILARTVKGKGVSFMENNNAWHHNTLSQKDYDLACSDIGEKYGLCEE